MSHQSCVTISQKAEIRWASNMHDKKKLRNFDVSTGVHICFMYCLCYWKFGGCRNIYRMLWLASFCLSFPSIVLWYMYCIATVSCSGSCLLRIQHLTHHNDMRVWWSFHYECWWFPHCVDVFVQGDQLLVKVNKITSIKTQLPYEYYSLEFCKPDTIINSAENLGEVLRGDRIENSVYMVSFSFFFIIWLPYMLPRLSEHHRCLHKYT